MSDPEEPSRQKQQALIENLEMKKGGKGLFDFSEDMLKHASPESREFMAMAYKSVLTDMADPIDVKIAEKINEKHIDKMLESAEKDNELSFRDTAQARKYNVLYLIIFAALFIFTTIYLVGMDKELYKEILKLLAIFLGGLGSGFGIKSYMDRDK